MSNQTSDNNKRIAKNTLFLYFRMLFMMAVSLYTSRVVLDALGIEDFGIYNVVGGFVAMFTFINTSMSSATERFLNYEMGCGNKNRFILFLYKCKYSFDYFYSYIDSCRNSWLVVLKHQNGNTGKSNNSCIMGLSAFYIFYSNYGDECSL